MTPSSHSSIIAGGPTAYGGHAFLFDPEARAASLGAPGAASPVLTAGYTGGGQTGGVSGRPIALAGLTYFLYDGDEPVCETDSAGRVTAVNTFGADGLVSRRIRSTSAFYAFDPSGSTAQRLDAGGNLVSSDLYDAFGQGQTTQGQSTASAPDAFGYGGQWG